jgi:hypothetical protein
MDDRIRNMREQNIGEVFGDYKKHGAYYLLATQMGNSERATYLQRNGANPGTVAELDSVHARWR